MVSVEEIPAGEGKEERGDRIHSNITMYRIQTRTGFGRPTTLGVVRQATIYLYEKYGEVYPKLCELARLEGKSFSELMSIAAKEYVELHYPGNPQLSLMSFTADGLKPARLEAKIVSREAEKWLKMLENPDCAEYLKKRIRAKDLPSLILKLTRLNQRLRDEKVSDLVDRGALECFGEGCA